jgi:hypothetical protein
MEISKELLKVSNILDRDSISMDNVATAYKRGEALDNLSWNMAMDCCNVDL